MYSILVLGKHGSRLNSYIKGVADKVITDADSRVIVYDKGRVKPYLEDIDGVEFPKNSLMFMESIARDNVHKVVIINRLDKCNLPVLQFLTKLPKYDGDIEVYISMLDSEEAGRDLVLQTLEINEIKHI